MSQTVDVNILVYASNRDAAEQPRSEALLAHLAEGPGLVVLLWPTLMSFLRIATSARIMDRPLTPDQAMASIASLIDRPHVRVVGEAEGFWPTYQGVARTVSARGNLVPDVHLVALMIQHGVSTIWSRDRGFRQFDGIVARNPFEDRYADGFSSAS